MSFFGDVFGKNNLKNQIIQDHSNNKQVYDENKISKVLGEKIGSGGQGEVYILKDDPRIAVKLFHKDQILQKGQQPSEKIHIQTKNKDLIACPDLTWPQIDIFNRNGAWVGYAMKKADGKPLSKLAHPKLYEKYFNKLNRMHIVEIFIHIIDVIKLLHENKVFVGDLNLENVLCNPESLSVSLIDNDSYQILHENKTYRCPVGRPEMTPLEHHGIDFNDVTRTVESDTFSLTILFFQCLMLGRHPYDNIGGGSPIENLRKGKFPYGSGGAIPGTNGAVPKGPWYIIWSHLPFKIKELFIRTFKEGVKYPEKRSTLCEWEEALHRYWTEMEKGWHEKVIRPLTPKSKDHIS